MHCPPRWCIILADLEGRCVSGPLIFSGRLSGSMRTARKATTASSAPKKRRSRWRSQWTRQRGKAASSHRRFIEFATDVLPSSLPRALVCRRTVSLLRRPRPRRTGGISLIARSPRLRAGQKRQGLPTIHSWICCSAQSRLTIGRLFSRGASLPI